MIYAALMTAGILEFIFALLLVREFFDMEAEKEAEYQEGYMDGYQDGKNRVIPLEITWHEDDQYYDALCDEANCWFGMDGDM